MKQLKIKLVDENLPFHHFVIMHDEKPAKVVLDVNLDTGEVEICNDTLGSMLPMDVWAGVVQRFELPFIPTVEGANMLLQDANLQDVLTRALNPIIPNSTRVYTDSQGNLKGYLDDHYIAEIEYVIEHALDPTDVVDIMTAKEAYKREEIYNNYNLAGRSVEEVAEDLRVCNGDFTGSGYLFIVGIEEFIENVKRHVEEEKWEYKS